MQKSIHDYALITGATSGIGRALAWEFARHGHPLVLVGHDEAQLQELKNEIGRTTSQKVVTHVIDLTQESALDELPVFLLKRGISVGTLVNNIGVGFRPEFAYAPMGNIIEIIRQEIEVLTRLTRLLLHGMVARNEGRIVNVGSIAGYQPGPLMAAYHASKAYVRSLSETLITELKGTNVTVTCLAPDPLAMVAADENEGHNPVMSDRSFLMDPREVASAAYGGLTESKLLHQHHDAIAA